VAARLVALAGMDCACDADSSVVGSIYFDYNASTPLDPQVREVLCAALGEVFANPSSVHQLGRRARVLLDEARERTALVLGCEPSELVFTSGGTESNNLAILGTARRLAPRGRHLISSPTEHPAVIRSLDYLARHEGFSVSWLPVDSRGFVSPEDLRRTLRRDTVLVSVMAANNETGALQNVRELSAVCQEVGVVFHTDAVQWFGKEPLQDVCQFGADLVSLCSHKFHGPKGAGVLYVRRGCQPEPLLFGGPQEGDRRAGTENLPAVLGLAEAVQRFVKPPVFPAAKLRRLTQRLAEAALAVAGVALQSPPEQRLANTVAFTVADCDSLSLVAGLDLEGICVSSGAACSTGALRPSHVLEAMGQPPALARSFVRFSLGRESTEEEVARAAEVLPRVIQRIRQAK
jgi:cysteine desulfurase